MGNSEGGITGEAEGDEEKMEIGGCGPRWIMVDNGVLWKFLLVVATWCGR